MRYTVVIESTNEPDHPGWYYAHIPALDLTTHGEGIEGAAQAARELVGAWVAELKANGKPVPRKNRAFISHWHVVLLH